MKKDEFESLFKEVKTGSPLDKHRILVLNADFRPISYHPLSTAHWKQVMFLHVKGEQTGQRRFNAVEYYPDVFVMGGYGRDGTRTRVQLPSVIANLEYRPPPKRVALSNENLWLRDGFTCQYTGERCSRNDLTRDHVWPRSRGGKDVWSNVVACRKDINEMKGNMKPEDFYRATGYTLIAEPYEPTWGDLYNMGRRFPPKFLHPTWADYLLWDVEDQEKVA